MSNPDASVQKTLSDIDLTSCDSEPIHLIGAIQPHGCLLVLNVPEWRVVQASENIVEYLGIPVADMLGRSFKEFINQIDSERLNAQLQSLIRTDTSKPLRLTLQLKGGSKNFTAQMDRSISEKFFVLDMEVESAEHPLLSFAELYDNFYSATLMLQNASKLHELCDLAVREVRAITGFDRVWIHRVIEEGHLKVIAELKRPDQLPFLGLHFPASDIPKQARRLYALNRLRLITDVNGKPSPLLPEINPITQAPLDLSGSMLRAVSPVHIEYLQNMQVQSSMSISLVIDGELWGLISCHHDQPYHVTYQQRSFCDFFARLVSMQIPLLEAKEQAEAELKLRIHLHEIQKLCTDDENSNLVSIIEKEQEHFLALVDADGASVHVGDDPPLLLGKTPPIHFIEELKSFVMQQDPEKVFFSDRMSEVLAPVNNFPSEATGLLAISLSSFESCVIMWFRSAQTQTIPWGGDMRQPVKRTSGDRKLSPRRSFEKWNEIVHDRSRPWLASEQRISIEFRSIAILNQRAHELAKLNSSLAKVNQELDSFAYVAAHDLKEPLRGIHTYASFLVEDYEKSLDEEGLKTLKKLLVMTKRMDALINSLLLYSQLDRTDLDLRNIDLNEVVRETCDNLQSRLKSTGTEVKLLGNLPSVYGDRGRLAEMFQNLIVNAVKYNEAAIKHIEIGSFNQFNSDGLQERVIYLRDNGIGIDVKDRELIFQPFKRLHAQDRYGGGSGAGLTIVKKIIERHGGRIWLESTPGKGTTFYFTLKVSTQDRPY